MSAQSEVDEFLAITDEEILDWIDDPKADGDRLDIATELFWKSGVLTFRDAVRQAIMQRRQDG